MRVASFVLVALGLLACGFAPAGAKVRRSPRPPLGASCVRRRRGAFDYAWPVKPFDVQHPIRGGFGDPRTVAFTRFGDDEAGTLGDYSFHNGLDIEAKVGTLVYPVVTGRVHEVGAEEVRVRASNRRDFQYVHIKPLVRVGERVLARTTALGTVLFPARHVHLTEVDHWRVVDPLIHLRPYSDRTTPFVRSIGLATKTGRSIEPSRLSGLVSFTAVADDLPPLPVPGAWNGFPLAPALVRARLVSSTGSVVWRRTAADFRRTEPTQQQFWDTYAAGTYQNFPVFDDRFYWRRPGRYAFLLTRHALDTRRFANGTYTLDVVAQDECGNAGSLRERVRIRN